MNLVDRIARLPSGAIGIAVPLVGDVILSGLAQPYAPVEIYKNANPTPLGVGFADAVGVWSLPLVQPVAELDIYRTSEGGIRVASPRVKERPVLVNPITITIPMNKTFTNEATPVPTDQDVIYVMSDPTKPMKFPLNLFGGRNVVVEGVHVLDCVTFFEFSGRAYLGSSCIDVATAGTWAAPFTERITDCVRFRGLHRTDGLPQTNSSCVENCWLGGLHGGSVSGHADCVQHLNKSDVARFIGRNLTCVSNYQIFIFQNQPGNLVSSSATRFIELENINTYHNRIPGDPGDPDTTAIFMGSGTHPGTLKNVYIDWWKPSTEDFSLEFVVNPTKNWVDSLGFNGTNGKTRLAPIPGPAGATGFAITSLTWPEEMGLVGEFRKGQPPGGDYCPKASVSLA